jgi:anti-anti-sigma regulatory factor
MLSCAQDRGIIYIRNISELNADNYQENLQNLSKTISNLKPKKVVLDVSSIDVSKQQISFLLSIYNLTHKKNKSLTVKARQNLKDVLRYAGINILLTI